MNTILKLAADFVVGATIGSLVTYFVVRDIFQAQADEQIENMRQYYLEHPPKKRKNEIEKNPEGDIPMNNSEPPVSKEKKNYEELAQRYTSRYQNPDLDDLVSRIEENDLDEDGDDVEIIFDRKDARENPYLIPEESYMRTYRGIFGSEALEYWVQDNVLTVSDSDEVLDILTTIGLDAVNALLDPNREDDIVFVRNEKLEMEYEVERKEGSYAEWIGEEEPPAPIPIPKVEQRRQKNKYEDDDD